MITFGQPFWFWALAAIPLMLALFLRNEYLRARLVEKMVAARLHQRLAGTVSVARRRFRFALLLVAFSAVVIALAQPRLGYEWEESKRKGRDIIIAVDVSKSMLATDLTPTRLGRAKLAAHDLINQLGGDRVGLVAFAGTAFLQAPLTVDHSAVLNALQELDPEIIPRGGTNIAAAIRTARDAFGKGESDNCALIIFTDGEELEDEGIAAAEKAAEVMRVFALGIGSVEGSLITLPLGQGTEFLKDPQGQIVKSRLDEDRLTKIAEVTGGFYIRFVGGHADLERIVREGLGKMSEQDIDARLSRHPIERYQWPLAFSMILLAASTLMGERRRVRSIAPAAATALLIFAWPHGAAAKNDGVAAYERREYPEALNRFSQQLKRQPTSDELHFNLGGAAYQMGDLERALQAFSRALTSKDPELRAKSAYNLGNTLVQRGALQKKKEPKLQDWRNALQHYAQALQVQPKNADAAYNAEVVRKMIAELEKEPPQSDEEKEDDKKQQNKDQNKDQQQEKQQQGGKGDKQQQDQSSKSEDEKSGEQQNEKDDGQGKKKEKDEKGGEKADEKENAEGGKNEKPEPSDTGEQGEKKEGDLKNAPQFGENKEGEQQEKEAALAEARAAADGKMTETQAATLLESLKGEDDRVQLLNPKEGRNRARVLRDW